jgi:hypothetical protein
LPPDQRYCSPEKWKEKHSSMIRKPKVFVKKNSAEDLQTSILDFPFLEEHFGLLGPNPDADPLTQVRK